MVDEAKFFFLYELLCRKLDSAAMIDCICLMLSILFLERIFISSRRKQYNVGVILHSA